MRRERAGSVPHACEENLDFLGALLDVSDVVEDQQLEGIESLKRTR